VGHEATHVEPADHAAEAVLVAQGTQALDAGERGLEDAHGRVHAREVRVAHAREHRLQLRALRGVGAALPTDADRRANSCRKCCTLGPSSRSIWLVDSAT
jgi:hypothetical protein